MAPSSDPRALQVAEMFEEIARSLASRRGVDATLAEIARLAVKHLEGCEFAGTSRIRGRQLSPAVADDVPAIVDAIQEELDEGPCLDAIAEHAVFRTGDLTNEERWPNFARRAHEEAGITSILSFRLFTERETIGALNLYATASDAFDETDVALGSVFATHASVALSAAQREAQLERKAASRDLIGEAKGILMARSDVGEDEAFELLRRASQRLNLKLARVAERIVHPEGTER
jgi:transcriptional regulator with GAF, ATPase, and Fis domain